MNQVKLVFENRVMGKNKLKLFDDEDDGCAPEEGAISINKAYAERYDNWRRLEELQKS